MKMKGYLGFKPEPRTCCVAAGEHDSGGSLGFAKRIFISKHNRGKNAVLVSKEGRECHSGNVIFKFHENSLYVVAS